MIHSSPPSPLLFPPPLLFPSLSLPFLPLPLYPPQTRCKRVEGMRSVAKMTIASARNIRISYAMAHLKRLTTYLLRQPSLCCCAARTSLGGASRLAMCRDRAVGDQKSLRIRWVSFSHGRCQALPPITAVENQTVGDCAVPGLLSLWSIQGCPRFLIFSCIKTVQSGQV